MDFIKLAHPEQTSAGKTLDVRMFSSNVAGQFIDDALAPHGRLQFAADVFAHLPVEVNEFSIDYLKRTLSSLLDEIDNFSERGFEGGRHNLPLRKRSCRFFMTSPPSPPESARAIPRFPSLAL